MSRYCQSCGSAVEADATTCHLCGEPLDAAPEGVMVEEKETTAAPAAVSKNQMEPAAAPRAKRGARLICGECGGENDPGASFCQNCGESLLGERVPRAAAPIAATGRGAGFRDYLIIGGVAVALAVGVFLLASPEEKTGPPLPAQQGQPGGQQGEGALPPGHPPMEHQAPTPTPEQQQRIAELERKVKEQPADYAAKLDLANIYYDLERHTEAVPLYQAYLEKNPDDPDARTDMAYSIASSGDIPGAIVELHKVTSGHPKHQNSAYNLAIMYLSTRNRDSTAVWLRNVVEIDSTSRQGQLALQLLTELESAHGAGQGAPGDSAGH